MRRSVPMQRLRGLCDSDRGLTLAEVLTRRQQYGANEVIEVTRNTWWDLLRDTARDPMIWFLLGTSALYGVLGEWTEALTLLVATAPLVGMDAFLHRRTRASTEGLSSRLATQARVVRDSAPVEVAATDIVSGDLALISAGAAFPADGIVLTGSELQVDESALTGEAFPIRKHPLRAPIHDGSEPAIDGEHWGFAGTRLLTGQATMRVVFTGRDTLYGEIVRSAVSSRQTRTPLQAAIAQLVTVLVAAAAMICLILAIVRLRQGYGWVDATVSALTLAVAALPEEFPVVFTFFLGVGVYRLAQRQALVRRAVSVENIGRISCICSDKTGTITEGRLRLMHLVPADGISDDRLLQIATGASRRDSNDPLDAAILSEAEQRGTPTAAPTVLVTYPFTEDRRRETAIVRHSDQGIIAMTKGSPEVLLSMSSPPPAEREVWSERVTTLATAGHKVVAAAWRALDAPPSPADEPDRGYSFAGLLALEDPVRDGVAHAIAICRGADIHTIMVTGDHPATALAVARDIGLGGESPRAITAEEMEARLSRQEGDSLRTVDIIARAVPSQKLALVRALQECGEIVAVTGDGVNDVPALQAADIGIAMGERGTRSAREVASIVLLDDNFRTIVRAIAEGRQLFHNLQLSFQYLLMIHIPLVLSAAIIPLVGYPMLYLPIHIVWLEMLIHPTALLVFQDLPPHDVLGARRDTRSAQFFSPIEWIAIGVTGCLITALVISGYVRGLGAGYDVGHARSTALAALTLSSAALCAALSRLSTWTARGIAGATVALSVVLIEVPRLAALLHMTPLHWDDWTVAGVGGALLAALPLAVNTMHAGSTATALHEAAESHSGRMVSA